MPSVGPVIEQGKDAEALGTDEALRTDHRHAETAFPRVSADLLGLDLRVAIGSDADELVGLVDRMTLRHAVDGGGGDLNHPRHTTAAARRDHIARTVDLRRTDVLRRIERQGRRGVHHHIAPLHTGVHRRGIAHIALGELEPGLLHLRIVEVCDVEHTDLLHALRAQMPNKIDAEKSATTCNKYSLHIFVTP